MSSTIKKLLTLVILLSIFFSGAVAGVAIDRSFARPKAARGSRVDRLVARFAQRLQLDARQREVVRKALLESRAATATARQRIEPELRAARQAARTKIAAALSAKQRARFHEMTKRYDARRAKRATQKTRASD